VTAAYEATAPTRIDLAGAMLDIWPIYLFHPGAVTISVALDRRVWCRVVTGVNGVVLESKDTLMKAEGRDLSEVQAEGGLALVANILRALGIEAGVHVTTQARVPVGAGLGVSSALAIAVAAAASQSVGQPLAHEALWPIARDAEAQSAGRPVGLQDHHAALAGGVAEVRLAPGKTECRRLDADPSGVEEHLMLVDSGVTRSSGIDSWDVCRAQIEGGEAARAALSRIASVAQKVRAALVDQRHADVPALIRAEWEARKVLAPAASTAEIDRIVEIAVSLGGAGKPCGAGGGGTVAVWIAPDSRERALSAFKEAGFKAFPIRLDLQGLSVERA
jgi:D-glycero-alpha-D-manno-heptose-7-phosphate kinase